MSESPEHPPRSGRTGNADSTALRAAAPPPAASACAAGESLAGRGRVERYLARGGMGEAYGVEDTALGVRVAPGQRPCAPGAGGSQARARYNAFTRPAGEAQAVSAAGSRTRYPTTPPMSHHLPPRASR